MDRHKLYVRQGRPAIALLYGADAEVAEWTANLIPHVEDFGPCIAIGVQSKGRLIAGIVYNEYQPRYGIIQLSMAAVSPMWARKEIIAELLRYPFEQLGVYKVFTAILPDNAMAIKVNNHVGFKREAVLAHHFGKKRHAVIMRMLRPDYDRLYGERNG
jgi:RimJ/RimL family protein N-acetyltransferase